jgi:hypothetical protein
MKAFLAILSLLGTLAVMDSNGSTRLYATFPMGNQVSVLEIDTGRTWMIHARDENGNSGDIIDYDTGDVYLWNYNAGCRGCDNWKHMEE